MAEAVPRASIASVYFHGALVALGLALGLAADDAATFDVEFGLLRSIVEL